MMIPSSAWAKPGSQNDPDSPAPVEFSNGYRGTALVSATFRIQC